MKKFLLLFVFSFIVLFLFSQQSFEIGNIPVSIGNENIGYPIKTDIIGDDPGEAIDVRFPVLARYIANKDEYVGNELIDIVNNTKTKIVNIYLQIEDDNEALFVVEGREFNRLLRTDAGYLVDVTDKYHVFSSTGNKSDLWKIEVKK